MSSKPPPEPPLCCSATFTATTSLRSAPHHCYYPLPKPQAQPTTRHLPLAKSKHLPPSQPPKRRANHNPQPTTQTPQPTINPQPTTQTPSQPSYPQPTTQNPSQPPNPQPTITLSLQLDTWLIDLPVTGCAAVEKYGFIPQLLISITAGLSALTGQS